MSVRNRIGVGLMWVASLFAAGAWAHAQVAVVPAPPASQTQAQGPTVIAGSDLGFRVDRQKGNTPVGTLVARVNGQWVEVEFGVGVKRLTAR